MTNLSRASGTASIPRCDAAEQPLYAPLSSPAVFWRPRHLAPSPMLNKLPYLFWVVDTLRPQTIVQIGLGDGLVYMALCQAAERIGAQTALTGLADSDQGVDSLLPAAFLARHNTEYAEFSILSARPLAEAARQHDGEVDLLVLNSPLDEAGTKALTENWLPMLSDRAVILVCEPERVLAEGALQRNLLSPRDRPALCGPMSPGHGLLDVILHGQRQPERLLALTAHMGDSALRMVARQVFGRLGQGLHDELEVEELRLQHQRETAGHQRTRHDVLFMRQALAEAEDRLVYAEAELAELRRRLAVTQAAHRADIARLSALRDQSEALKAARDKYRVVTRQLAEARGSLNGEKTIRGTQYTSTDGALKAVNEENEKLARRIRLMEASTSWRFTRPLRGIKRLLSGADQGK